MHYSSIQLNRIFTTSFSLFWCQNFLTFRTLRDFTARDGTALLVVALVKLWCNGFFVETIRFQLHSRGFRLVTPSFCNARNTVTHKGHHVFGKPWFWPFDGLILENWCFSSFGFLGGLGDYRRCHQLILSGYELSILRVFSWLLIDDFQWLFWLYLFNLAHDCVRFWLFWSDVSRRFLAN